VRGVVAWSHPLNHFLVLLVEFNLTCETCVLPLTEVTFLPLISVVLLSQSCLELLVTILLFFTDQSTVLTKSSHALAEYCPVCLF